MSPTAFEVTATERLGKVESRLDHIESSIKRIEHGIDKVVSKIDDHKQELRKEYKELDERVQKMERWWSAAFAIITLITLIWPAILKWWPS